MTAQLWFLEQQAAGLDRGSLCEFCENERLDSDLLASAFELKKLAGQINVIIHTAGILAALPRILEAVKDLERGPSFLALLGEGQRFAADCG